MSDTEDYKLILNPDKKGFDLDNSAEDRKLAGEITSKLTADGFLYGKDYWITKEGLKVTEEAMVKMIRLGLEKLMKKGDKQQG